MITCSWYKKPGRVHGGISRLLEWQQLAAGWQGPAHDYGAPCGGGGGGGWDEGM